MSAAAAAAERRSPPICFFYREIPFKGTGNYKAKGLGTCYSAAYMSQTRDQQRFTISVVAADWHEPMVPQRIMWPSIARAQRSIRPTGQL